MSRAALLYPTMPDTLHTHPDRNDRGSLELAG